MTREELEKTEWAKGSKKFLSNPTTYELQIQIALSPKSKYRISMMKNFEFKPGMTFPLWKTLWAIESNGQLMELTPTKKKAVEFCKEMGWRISK